MQAKMVKIPEHEVPIYQSLYMLCCVIISHSPNQFSCCVGVFSFPFKVQLVTCSHKRALADIHAATLCIASCKLYALLCYYQPTYSLTCFLIVGSLCTVVKVHAHTQRYMQPLSHLTVCVCVCVHLQLTPSPPSCKQARSTDTSNLVQHFTPGEVQMAQSTDIQIL